MFTKQSPTVECYEFIWQHLPGLGFIDLEVIQLPIHADVRNQ